jgi:hypothetical protein
MKYVIISEEEVSNINFSEVLETSLETLRYSLNRNNVLLKFKGATPTFLIGKVQYDYDSIMNILNSAEWNNNEII